MKIKYKPLKGVKKTKAYHAWLSPELPKKGGRLSQLNKSNRRKPSEFVLMAQQIEENGTRRR